MLVAASYVAFSVPKTELGGVSEGLRAAIEILNLGAGEFGWKVICPS